MHEIESRKAREVASREHLFTTCLVGYTNAGKSSLLNRLTGDNAYVEDQLFANSGYSYPEAVTPGRKQYSAL